ncbi:MAG: alpha/beta fold hydrolase [Planctomycetaceae bacterium]|nr:alpha/beta fold hydrolase [Planctomycetaceae bacterium]
MHRIPLSNVELHTVDCGSGPPLLFVHGFPLDHTMWQGQIDHFAATHRVIAPDLRGFGKSEVKDQPVSMTTYADDLAELLDALSVSEPVSFCGLSMGGYIAWAFVERYRDRLASLILCDTRAAADNEAARRTREQTALRVLQEGPAFLADGMLEKLFAPQTRAQNAAIITETQNMIRSTSPTSVAAASRAMANRPDVTDRLAKIELPALLIAGEHDAISPPSEMREVAQALPRATFVEIADAGHMAPLEQPAPVNAAIEHFLAACEG